MPSAQNDDRASHHAFDPQTGSTPPATPTGVRTRAVVPAKVALIALGALLVLAALVFIGLPAWLTTPTPTAVAPTPSGPPADTAPRAAYDPTVSVRERLLAEEAVADYLNAREALEQRGVALWAAEALAGAEQLADEGEAALGERDYPEGTRLYRLASDRLGEIAGMAETIYAKALADGDAAIDAADPAGAIAAFEIAVAIHPDAEESIRGLNRAQNLERVLARMSEGKTLELSGELEAAVAAYEQAAIMDPAYPPAQEALARARERLTRMRFQAEMSRGLEQLARVDWQGAEASFAAASRLRPGDPGAADGLAQAREGLLRQRITRLEQRARALESEERWQEAVSVYNELLGINPALDVARSGRARSERLAKLHAQVDQVLAQPDRLYSERARAQATAILEAAREVQPQGPRLADSIARLAQTLDRASTPRTVRLTSNGVTEVTIYRVGKLGSFLEHHIALRPGTYTVVGSRPGFRDVRRQLSITPETPAPALHIACEEPV